MENYRKVLNSVNFSDAKLYGIVKLHRIVARYKAQKD
jgi:hypothetical protein